MAEARKPWRWWVLPVVALVVWGIARGGGDADDGQAAPGDRGSPSPSASDHPREDPSASPGEGRSKDGYDPAAYARQTRTHAKAAGISPRLLMAILYNEDYKPHDPELERSWQRFKPGAAFGIANMHRAAFDETKQNHGFADRRWEELPDDRDLALKAAAWHLHDLSQQLPADAGGGALSRDELLALGYNAGAGNMLAFQRGAKPGSQAGSYLDRLRDNWDKAAKALEP